MEVFEKNQALRSLPDVKAWEASKRGESQFPCQCCGVAQVNLDLVVGVECLISDDDEFTTISLTPPQSFEPYKCGVRLYTVP